jgi:hypothetical protein
LAGNYNECAQLSAVIVKANTNADNPNTRAVMFHLGKFIPTGVPDTYGFNGIDNAATTGDTVALMYANGATGLRSLVRFHWNGNGVELVGTPLTRYALHSVCPSPSTPLTRPRSPAFAETDAKVVERAS